MLTFTKTAEFDDALGLKLTNFITLEYFKNSKDNPSFLLGEKEIKCC
jgi:hypothetical protein